MFWVELILKGTVLDGPQCNKTQKLNKNFSW